MRGLEFDQLQLPAPIRDLGRPDAVYGLHPARELFLWVCALVPGMAGLWAGATILLGGITPSTSPVLFMLVLLGGGGAALACTAYRLKLKGRILLVYLDCLVLMDYEQSRVVDTAREQDLRAFAAPGTRGYQHLLQELSRLSLVGTDGREATFQSGTVREAVGQGFKSGTSESGKRRSPANPLVKTLILSGISMVLGYLLFSQLFTMAVNNFSVQRELPSSNIGMGASQAASQAASQMPQTPVAPNQAFQPQRPPGQTSPVHGSPSVGPATAPPNGPPPQPGLTGPQVGGVGSPGPSPTLSPPLSPFATPAPQRIYSPYETPPPPINGDPRIEPLPNAVPRQ